MADNFQKIDDIFNQVRQLVDRHKSLKKENDELADENKALREKVEAEQARVTELERQLKMLQLARQVSGSHKGDDDKQKELKQAIDTYIREIDDCIAMLKSE